MKSSLRLIAGMTFAVIALSACSVETDFSPAGDGRLSARPPSVSGSGGGAPAANSRGDFAPGSKRALGLDRSRDGVLQLPTKPSGEPLPLLVMLHGAGGSGEGVLRRVTAAAEEAGVAVLAPDSRDSTWDGIRG